jgi:hypothetical protein
MSRPVSALTLQFLDWLSSGPRTYAEVMEAWRTSCPRLSVWEDANIDGLVRFEGGNRKMVGLTPLGRAALDAQSPSGTDGRPAAPIQRRRVG